MTTQEHTLELLGQALQATIHSLNLEQDPE